MSLFHFSCQTFVVVFLISLLFSFFTYFSLPALCPGKLVNSAKTTEEHLKSIIEIQKNISGNFLNLAEVRRNPYRYNDDNDNE